MQCWTVTLNHSIYLLYLLFSRVTRTLTIILNKPIKNSPFIGYSETSDLIICGPLNETQHWDPIYYTTLITLPNPAFYNNVLLSGGAKPPTGTLLLYYSITLYKSPEKKWHRSPKMDKNKNVHFSKVPGKCCKMPL